MKRILVILAAFVFALGLTMVLAQSQTRAHHNGNAAANSTRNNANGNNATGNNSNNGGEQSGWANPSKAAQDNNGNATTEGNDQAVPTNQANTQMGASTSNNAGNTGNSSGGGGNWGLLGLLGLLGFAGLGGRRSAVNTDESIRPEDRRRVA